MMPIAVRPMAIPISTRRKPGSGKKSCRGDFGYSNRVVTTAAETMKSPRPAASIRYSGQCWRRPSTHERMGLDPSCPAGRSNRLGHRRFHRPNWIKEPLTLHALIALVGQNLFVDLIAGFAPPGGDHQHALFFLDRLAAVTLHGA